MLIQLLSKDIPRYWEVIKFACATVDEVDDAQRPAYLRDLLCALLSEKAQCWVRFDDDKQLILIYVTRILYNAQYDEKYLYIQAGYSWKRLGQEAWNGFRDLMMEFAKREGCAYIGHMSRNPRIWELALGAGFKESTRIFAYRIPKE